jgi:hypothetical protein
LDRPMTKHRKTGIATYCQSSLATTRTGY